MYPANTAWIAGRAFPRIQEAYTQKNKPIGWWEPNKEAAGVIQLFLHQLGYNLSQSIQRSNGPSGPEISLDGVFGQETHDAVAKFQRDNSLKPDGMVGRVTLDLFGIRLDTSRREETRWYHKVSIDRKLRPCPPGAVICPDPDTER